MTLEALATYRDLAYHNHCPASRALLHGSPESLASRHELVQRFPHLVKVAIGRLGAQLSPYLDESLLIGRGLMTLIEATEHAGMDETRFEEVTARQILEDLRRWAQGTGWFRAAWSRRVEPLCAAACRCDPRVDEDLAAELGLDTDDLQEAFVEGGLVFGVSPERMIPVGQLSPAQRADLASAIAGLRPPQAKLLTLYFQERLSFPEIVELLEVPPDEVQALYGRCAVTIRAALTTANDG